MQGKPDKTSVKSLLLQAEAGELAVPDFQRDFVWKATKIVSLLESVGAGYYSGGLLFLATEKRSPSKLFKPRQLRGLRGKPQRGATLILDGQQRVNSLYYVVSAPDVSLNERHRYAVRFYVDLEILLEKNPISRHGEQTFEDLEGVFLFFRDGQAKAERLVDSRKIAPLSELLRVADTARAESALQKWITSFDEDTSFHLGKLRESIFNYEFPVIEIPSTEDADYIIGCFTRINEGGTPLKRFDLAHARLKPKKVDMRKMWKDAVSKKGKKNLIGWAQQHKWISEDSLLQTFALAAGKTPKAGDIFELIGKTSGPQAKKLIKEALAALGEAVSELRGPLGVVQPTLLPTPAIIPALGAIMREMGGAKHKRRNRKKIHAWYWSAILTGRYSSAVNTNSIADLKSMKRWIKGGNPPGWIAALAATDISHAWNSPKSPQYRAVTAALIVSGLRDLLTDEKILEMAEPLQDDHIFCQAHFGSKWGINALPNRLLTSAKSNGASGKSALLPSRFAELLMDTYSSEDDLDKNLKRACIPIPEGWDAMCSDDYDAFQKARTEALRDFLVDFLEKKLDRPIGDQEDEWEGEDWDEEDEDDEDDEDDDWEED